MADPDRTGQRHGEAGPTAVVTADLEGGAMGTGDLAGHGKSETVTLLSGRKERLHRRDRK